MQEQNLKICDFLSEMPLGEGVTRAGFKIRFKRNRFFFCFKSNINFNFPRSEFRCVRHIAFVMFCQTLECVFIPRNKSSKLKTVADNTILRNYAVPSENISERIKIKQRTAFTSNEMSVNSDRIKSAPENSWTTDNYLNPAFSSSSFVLKPSYEFGICCCSFSIFTIACSGFFRISLAMAVSKSLVSSIFLKLRLLWIENTWIAVIFWAKNIHPTAVPMLVTIRRMTAIHRAVGPNRRGKVQAAVSDFMGWTEKVFRYRVTQHSFWR